MHTKAFSKGSIARPQQPQLSESVKKMLHEYSRDLKKQKATENDNRTKNFKGAMDSADGNVELAINNQDFSPYDKINRYLLNSKFLGYPEYALLSQNGLIQNVVQNIAQDSVREWITFYCTDDSGNKKDIAQKILKIEALWDKLDVRARYQEAVEQKQLFGGCKWYPKINGDDSIEGGSEYQAPLIIDKGKIPRNSLRYLKLIEPQYATPVGTNYRNALAKDFYEPPRWQMQGGTIIDSTRLGHFTYNSVPTLLKPVYYFNGYPLVQLILDYMYAFEKTRQEITGIVGRYNINVLKTNILALISDPSGYPVSEDTQQERASILERMEIAQVLQNNFSIFAVDNDPTQPEEWQQFSMNLTGLSDILAQKMEIVCAVAGYPAIKLLGTSPKGFNSTGEIELKMYYDKVHSSQERDRPAFTHLLNITQMSLFGEIIPGLNFRFNPLWKMTELEKTQIQKTKSEINSTYLADGVLSGEEVRRSISNDPDSGYDGLELDNSEIDMDDKDEKEDDADA